MVQTANTCLCIFQPDPGNACAPAVRPGREHSDLPVVAANQETVLLPRGKRILNLAHKNTVYPLHQRLQRLSCTFTGNPSRHEEFKVRLTISLWHRGDHQPKSSTPRIFASGESFVFQSQLIPPPPLLRTWLWFYSF